MDNLTYATRNCVVCFKPFAPKYAAQVTCSEICRKTRKTKLKIASAIRIRELPWEELEWANRKLEEAIARERARSGETAREKTIAKTAKEAPENNETAKPISVMPSKDPYGEPEIKINMEAVAKSASAKSEPAPEPQAKNRDQFAKKYRHICANCGCVFKSERKDDKYCCDQCVRESAPCGVM